jgi:hypothetical protein
VLKRHYDIGIAWPPRAGCVPVVRGAAGSLLDLAEIERLSQASKAGQARPEDRADRPSR